MYFYWHRFFLIFIFWLLFLTISSFSVCKNHLHRQLELNKLEDSTIKLDISVKTPMSSPKDKFLQSITWPWRNNTTKKNQPEKALSEEQEQDLTLMWMLVMNNIKSWLKMSKVTIVIVERERLFIQEKTD